MTTRRPCLAAGFSPILLAAIICVPIGPVSAASTRLKVATVAPENSVFGTTLTALAADIEKRTDGAVRLKPYFGGVQGDERTVLRKIRIGQLHGAGFLGTGLAMICPDAMAMQLPLVFDNYEEADHALAAVAPHLAAQALDNGYVILAWPLVGFSYLFSKGEVKTVAELRQSKPCVLPDDDVAKTFFQVARVNAAPLGVGDVLMGLQSGLVRTVVSPPIGMIAMQWFSRIKYRLDVPITLSMGTFAISRKAWERLDAAHRETVSKLATEHIAALNRKVREQSREALEVMTREQVVTVRPTDTTLAELRDISTKVAAKLQGDAFSARAQQLLKQGLEAYRAEQAREQK